MASSGPKGLFYTESFGTGLRIAQVVGLTSTAFFAGITFSQTFSTTPAFLEAPAPLLAKQWKKMIDSDKVIAPVALALGASVSGFMAYRESNLPNHSTPTSLLYTISTALLLSNIPYTLLFSGPLAQKLLDKESDLASTAITDTAAEAGVAQEETVHYLVDRWATANLGNAVLSGLAALTATWAAVDKIEVVAFALKD